MGLVTFIVIASIIVIALAIAWAMSSHIDDEDIKDDISNDKTMGDH